MTFLSSPYFSLVHQLLFQQTKQNAQQFAENDGSVFMTSWSVLPFKKFYRFTCKSNKGQGHNLPSRSSLVLQASDANSDMEK